MIFLLKFLLKMLQNRRFSAWAPSDFGAAICVSVLIDSIGFGTLVSADRSGMAASRFLTAAAALVFCS